MFGEVTEKELIEGGWGCQPKTAAKMSFETMMKYGQDIKYVEMFYIATFKLLSSDTIGRKNCRIL